ncbi:MAG: AMP-binding protein [Acidimicrobiales bacterium]
MTAATGTHVDSELSYARGPAEPAVLDETIGGVLRRAAATSPDMLALFGTRDDRRWTYAELLADAEAGARALLERFEPGERVAIWAQNVPEWVLAEYAIALAGLTIVTVNPNFGGEEAAYVFNQSGTAAVLASASYRGRDLAAISADLQESCPTLREVIDIGTFGDLVEAGRDLDIALPDLDPGDLVMIQYTSGTTGFPKGAQLHHRGLVTNGYHTCMRNGMEPGAVMLGVMPLFHTGGSVLAVLGASTVPGTLALVEEFEPGHMLEAVETYGAATLNGVPTMLVAMLEHPTYAERDLSSIKVMTSGGSTVPAALVERLEKEIGAPFTIVFGQTELSPVCTMTRPDDAVADKAATLGTPMPHLEIKIVDEAGETVPHGVPGELCCRGYSVMLGYNDNPEATAETIDGDGWLHTGDLCSMDERGFCTITGRLKDMIIRGGENIYPREIEEVLFRHPAVADVAVVGLPDDKWGEVVSAFVRVAGDDVPGIQELRTYLREHLAPHKTPVHWFVTEEFPLTGSGKVQKFRLVEQWTKGETQPLDTQPLDT